MEDLLSYLYTGNVEITNESRARDLLFAADYLVVPRLNKIAGEFLLKNLSVLTCISVYKLAVATRNKVLGDGTLNFINKNFVLVSKSEEFLNLSADEVIEWVSSDDVEIRSEDEMFEVVISWVEHSPDRRKKSPLGLLRYVRLTLVTPSYLHSKILKNGLIEDSKDCVKLVLKSMENLANQQDGSLCENPRKCLETHVHCLLACGGHTKTPTQPSDLTCCFVPDTGKWYKLYIVKLIQSRTEVWLTLTLFDLPKLKLSKPAILHFCWDWLSTNEIVRNSGIKCPVQVYTHGNAVVTFLIWLFAGPLQLVLSKNFVRVQIHLSLHWQGETTG